VGRRGRAAGAEEAVAGLVHGRVVDEGPRHPLVVADRVNERLGQADAGMVHLRRIWARELKALAENRPLKQWERTAKVQAMSGGLEAKSGEGITAEAIAGGTQAVL